MPSARIWFICGSFFSFVACESSPAEPKAQPAKAEPTKAEPTKIEPTKVEPAQPPVEPAQPPVEPAQPSVEPLSFNLGTRTFTGATALSSRFNDQRRIIISSLPTTCEQLLAMPEQFQKGNVNFIITTEWKVGTHPLASAEILDDDTHAVTNIYPQNATIEILAAPQVVGERGTIKVSAAAAEGGARGQIDVLLCE